MSSPPKNRDVIQKLFKEEEIDYEAQMRIMNEDNHLTKIELEEIFDPEELKEKFETKEDKKIVNKDTPERLLLRFKRRSVPTN